MVFYKKQMIWWYALAFCFLMYTITEGNVWAALPVMGALVDPPEDAVDIESTAGPVDEDATLVITLTEGNDADGADTLAYHIIQVVGDGVLYQFDSSNPGNIGNSISIGDSVSDSQRRVVYDPENKENDYTLTIHANVNDGSNDSPNKEIISINVTCLNNPPYIGSIGASDIITPINTNEDSDTVQITLTNGVDQDSTGLFLKIVVLPDQGGKLFQNSSGSKGPEITLNGTVTDSNSIVIYEPANRSVTYIESFQVKANDGTSNSENKETITLTVTCDNDPPEFTSTPEYTAKPDATYSYVAETNDPDVDHASASLTVTSTFIPGLSPDWLSFSVPEAGKGLLRGTPTGSHTGNTYLILLQVTGPGAQSAQQFFPITVVGVHTIYAGDEPEIDSDTTWAYEKVVIKGGEEDDDDTERPANFIRIKAGVTLTISEGTIVEFQNGCGLIVNGGLIANGNRDKETPVIFKGRDWGGITFENANQPSTLTYATIESVSYYFGGGIRAYSTDNLNLEYCTISNNESTIGGGGLLCVNSSISITNCLIENNKDGLMGGGIYSVASDLELTGNSISSNEASKSGGGLFSVNSTITLTNNRIHNNSAANGAGICGNSSVLTFNKNHITNNDGKYGGGIYAASSTAGFTNNLIVNNYSLNDGGGINAVDGSVMTLTNNTIAYNKADIGGGIYCAGSTLTCKQIILSGNVGGTLGDQLYADGSATVNFTYSCIQGGNQAFSGGGSGTYQYNIEADPMFDVPPEKKGKDGDGLNAKWTLKPSSACINAGDTTPSGTDFIDNPRPYNSMRIDMGAYEYQNNPPYIGINGTNSHIPPADLSQALSSDEDTEIMITLNTGLDPDGDNVAIIINSWPPNKSKLYQYKDGEKGDEILAPDSETSGIGADSLAIVEDEGGRIFFVPANRSTDYTETLYSKVQDDKKIPETDDQEEISLIMPSRNKEVITISITADDDLPEFSTTPPTDAYAEKEYKYAFEADDPDAEDQKSTLIFQLSEKPSWLSNFVDNKDGTGVLSGTPTLENVGEGEVLLRVSDDAGNTKAQEFIINVGPQKELEVTINTRETSVAPDTAVLLSATGTEGDGIQYIWLASDEDGSHETEGSGQDFSFTPQAEGFYTVTVTISETGSLSASDSVTITAVNWFEPVDDESRIVPTEAQKTIINNFEELDPNSSGFNAIDRIEEIYQLSQLDLNSSELGNLITAAKIVLDAVHISNDGASKLLSALDNLIIENPISNNEQLISSHISDALYALKKIVDTVALRSFQIPKAIEIVNEILEQQGEDHLLPEHIGEIRIITEMIVRKTVVLEISLNACNLDFIKVSTLPAAHIPDADSFSVGSNAEKDSKIIIPNGVWQEITTQSGIDNIIICLVASSVTAGHGVLVSASLYKSSGEEINVKNLVQSLSISIPVTDSAKKNPLFFDTETGLWSKNGISNVDDSIEGIVTFDVSHLTDFALHGAVEALNEENDALNQPLESIKDIVGCFISFLLME